MTTPTQDTRDRVIRMEGKIEQLERKIDDLDAKVTEMYQLLTQAKGARWMLMLMIDMCDFVIDKIVPIIQSIPGK
ncbi:hypothetical protein [Pseudochrobactrum asaccharolyticum]|uniref:hypothetical protein n=1 Tax=Pseudochrobactrum asaccharolyticum TaxID=354351 RepID=UPI004042CD7A